MQYSTRRVRHSHFGRIYRDLHIPWLQRKRRREPEGKQAAFPTLVRMVLRMKVRSLPHNPRVRILKCCVRVGHATRCSTTIRRMQVLEMVYEYESLVENLRTPVGFVGVHLVQHSRMPNERSNLSSTDVLFTNIQLSFLSLAVLL